jgi:hypothetical protein
MRIVLLPMTRMALASVSNSRSTRWILGISALVVSLFALWLAYLAENPKAAAGLILIGTVALLYVLMFWMTGMLNLSRSFSAANSALTPNYLRSVQTTAVIFWCAFTWVVPLTALIWLPEQMRSPFALFWLVYSLVYFLTASVTTVPWLGLSGVLIGVGAGPLEPAIQAISKTLGQTGSLAMAGLLNLVLLVWMLRLLFGGGPDEIAARNKRLRKFQTAMTDPSKACQVDDPISRFLNGRYLQSWLIERLFARAKASASLMRSGLGPAWHWSAVAASCVFLLILAVAARLMLQLMFEHDGALQAFGPSFMLCLPIGIASSMYAAMVSLRANPSEQGLVMLLPGAPQPRARSNWLMKQIASHLMLSMAVMVPCLFVALLIIGWPISDFVQAGRYVLIGIVACLPWVFMRPKPGGSGQPLGHIASIVSVIAIGTLLLKFESRPELQMLMLLTWLAMHAVLCPLLWWRRRTGPIALPVGQF